MWKQVKANSNLIQTTTDKAVLIKLPKSDFKFWHPAKLVKTYGKNNYILEINYTNDFKFKCFKNGSGSKSMEKTAEIELNVKEFEAYFEAQKEQKNESEVEVEAEVEVKIETQKLEAKPIVDILALSKTYADVKIKDNYLSINKRKDGIYFSYSVCASAKEKTFLKNIRKHFAPEIVNELISGIELLKSKIIIAE